MFRPLFLLVVAVAVAVARTLVLVRCTRQVHIKGL